MIIQKKGKQKHFRTKLIFSLEENGYTYDYYKVENHSNFIYLLDEHSRKSAPDYYTVFFNWNEVMDNLKRFESSNWLPRKNNWWSYCPQWVYLNPDFVDDAYKSLFSNEICNLLDGIFEDDLSETEQYVFRLWMNACDVKTLQFELIEK